MTEKDERICVFCGKSASYFARTETWYADGTREEECRCLCPTCKQAAAWWSRTGGDLCEAEQGENPVVAQRYTVKKLRKDQ